MSCEVQVGVAVIVLREGRVLLGERIGSHGADTWGVPGGHLERGEGIEDCARRETLEETGLSVDGFRKLSFTNDIFEHENKHYVTLFVVTSCPEGEPRVVEPDKCTQWAWFALDDLPKPLFLPVANLLKDEAIVSRLL